MALAGWCGDIANNRIMAKWHRVKLCISCNKDINQKSSIYPITAQSDAAREI